MHKAALLLLAVLLFGGATVALLVQEQEPAEPVERTIAEEPSAPRMTGRRAGTRTPTAAPNRPSLRPRTTASDPPGKTAGKLIEIQGELVDLNERPVPFATVTLIRREPMPQGGFRGTRIAGSSDATGQLRFSHPAKPTRWYFELPPHLQLQEPAYLDVLPSPPVQRLRLVVAAPAQQSILQGRVQDVDGKPVGFVRVMARSAGGQQVAAGSSDRDGRFLLWHKGHGPESPAVHLAVHNQRNFDDLHTPQTYRWGSTDVVLTLRRAGELQLRVVGPDGQPVERFRATWNRIHKTGATYGNQAVGRYHGDGEVRLRGVPRGRIGIIVEPEASHLADASVEIQHDAARSKVRVELRRMAKLKVTVVDGQDRVVTGSRVELLQSPNGHRIMPRTFALKLGQLSRMGTTHDFALRLDSARTDARGNVLLHGPSSNKSLTLRASGTGHLTKVVGNLQLSAGRQTTTLRLVVDRGASLTGSVRPLALLQSMGIQQPDQGANPPHRPHLILTFVGEDPIVPSRRYFALNGQGHFAAHGLQPGPWNVMFHEGLSPAVRPNARTQDFGTIEVTSDKPREAHFQLPDLRHGDLRGLVTVDGEPHRRGFVYVTTVPDPRHHIAATRQTVPTDDAGRFHAKRLGPGRYRLTAVSPPGQPRLRLTPDDAVEIRPTATTRHEFHIRTGSVHITVLDAKQQPVPRYNFQVRGPLQSISNAVTDDQGVLRISRLAAGPYRLGIYQEGRAHRLLDFTVHPGTTPSRWTVRLPWPGAALRLRPTPR